MFLSLESQAQILIRCPQCGGDIGFLEESREIRCQFCGTALLVAGRERVLRFALPLRLESSAEAGAAAREYLRSRGEPSAEPEESLLFYAPFWRLQGRVYRWVFGARPMKVETEKGVPPPLEKMKTLLIRLMDHTLPGFKGLDLGVGSLGIRAQALQLRPCHPGKEERKAPFLPLEVPLAEAEKEAVRLAEIFFQAEGLQTEVALQSLVGRIFSVVYLPLWLVRCRKSRGSVHVLVDGLSKAPLRSLPDGAEILFRLGKEENGAEGDFGELRFLPLKCPNCGWAFSFQPFTHLPFCMTCRRLWRVRDTALAETEYRAVAPPSGEIEANSAWIPFWRCRTLLESGGDRLETMADLYRFAPPPRAVDRQRESRRPIYFYIPAVNFSNPQTIHNLGSRLTFLQPELQTAPFPDGSRPPAAGGSLSEKDARDLGPVIFGSMIPQSNRRARAWLKDCKIDLQEAQIHYFSFARADLFWKELHTGIAFQHNAFPGDLPPGRA
jgi:DNA-directed RNA polymerase subunit RPC12/RpoP